MSYQNVRGTQDYLPAEEVVRRNVRQTIEDVFMQYGCEPLETPILNYTSLLDSKYGGGAEILEEMYRLTDRGERDLALRYDLTIPFAKVVAMNPTIQLPFKRYEIGKVFRDGPIKKGRLREFTQCDVDIVGAESQMAESELMLMTLDVFEQLKLQVTIQYNNRKLLMGLLTLFNVAVDKINRTILTLDKLKKIGSEAVLIELKEQNLETSTLGKLEGILIDRENIDISTFEAYAQKNEMISEGLRELKELQDYLQYLAIDKQCVFNPFLARGSEIYSGTIYEMFLTDGSITSSVGSGGRYDNTIGGLIGTDEKFSTVGISYGLDVIYTALSMKEEQMLKEINLDYFIIPLNTQKEALLVAQSFRKKGYKVACDFSNKRLGRILERANKEKVENVIIIGEDEVNNNYVKIKNMITGDEEVKQFMFK